jgi:hypothetical protein
VEGNLIGGKFKPESFALVYCGARVFIGSLIESDPVILDYAGELVGGVQMLPGNRVVAPRAIIGLGYNQGPVRDLVLCDVSAMLSLQEDKIGSGTFSRIVDSYEQFLENSVGDISDKIEIAGQIPEATKKAQRALDRLKVRREI